MLQNCTVRFNNRTSAFFLCLGLFFCINNVWSQCNLLCNTDFENLQNSPSVIIVDTSLVPCWGTTASDNQIEVWHTGFNGVPSYSGNQFIELNAFFVSTLFQNFVSVPGTLLTVSFAHRGRVGTDVMSVEVGPVGGPYTTLGAFSDGNTVWGYYTVNYIVPTGVGNNFSLRFNSVSAAGGNPALGNFLDAISVNLPSNATLNFSSLASSCAGSHDGGAFVSVNNGSGPYSYTWSPTGVHTNSLSSVTAGIYTVYVSESNGCATSGTVQVSQGPVLSTSVIAQNESCLGANNGSAQVIVFGNGSPASYTWSPGAIHSATATGLAPGIYSVQVANSTGCMASNTVLINAGTVLNTFVTSQDISCFGANDGTAQVSTGTAGTYSYTWTPGTASTASINGLSAGMYTVQTASSTGCVVSNTVMINQGTQLTFSLNSQNTTCSGVSDGSAQIIISGGITPYTYTWFPAGGNTAAATGLAPGIYTVQAKSFNGCTVSSTMQVIQGPSLNMSVSSQSTSCLGAADGTAQVTINSGSGPYSYTWSPLGGNSANAINLSSGTYTILSQSATGCTGSSTVLVNPGPGLPMVISSQSVSCLGATDGSAQVIIGSSGPYSYTWTPTALHSFSISGVPSGDYTVNVANSGGCTGTETVSILPGLPLNLAVTTKNTLCPGSSDGTAELFVNGGTGPYTYTWMPVASNTATVTGLPSGIYTVQSVSSNGCSGTTTVSIAEPLPLNSSVFIQSISCFGGSQGSAQISVSGGTAPYSYTWSPGGINSSTLSVPSAGIYTCNISDINLCSTTVTAAVISAPSPTISVNSTTVCLGSPATLHVYGAVSYTWLPGNSNGEILLSSPLTTTNYSVIGENTFGCIDTITASVFVSNYPLVFAGNDTTVNMDEPITLVGSGSDFYGWIPMNDESVLSCNLCHTITENPQQNTCYVLEAINEFNCKNRDTVCVTVTEDWSIYIPNAFTPNGNDINDVFIPVGYGIEEIELFIFDRWGALIFKSDDKTRGWNGTYKNVLCKSDVYVYKINFTTMNHREEQRVGSVTLLK